MLDVWTHTGVGVVVVPNGMVFGTQLFATQSMTQLDMNQRFHRF